MRRPFALLLLFVCVAAPANAQDAWQWSGFALLRAGSDIGSGPLRSEPVSSQVQFGIDWTPTPRFGAHVHLLGRTDDASRRGHAGVVEAYAEANFRPRGDRLRLRAGAFFLPGSRENVDALWESPYAITSSALNSWLREELRPIGVDAAYYRRGAMVGATLYRGSHHDRVALDAARTPPPRNRSDQFRWRAPRNNRAAVQLLPKLNAPIPRKPGHAPRCTGRFGRDDRGARPRRARQGRHRGRGLRPSRKSRPRSRGRAP